MVVTDIKSQKRTGFYSVFIDGKYRFSLDSDTLGSAGLYRGDEIDESRIDDLLRKSAFARAREYGYLLLSYRDRSERELRNRLLQKDFDPGTVREVAGYFKREGLVDDRVFARKWLDNTLASRPMGRLKARYELMKRGVSAGIVEEATAEIDLDMEYRLARDAAGKKLRALSGYPPDVARPRMLRFLRGRGFHFDVIHDLMEEYFGQDV